MPAHSWRHGVTRYQWLVLLVAWLGWVFDAMDGTIYAMVQKPVITELLGPGASAAAPRAFNSLVPARMARRDTPVARATADTPPAPAAATSAAATSRRSRSSRCGSISRNRRRIAFSATIHGIL